MSHFAVGVIHKNRKHYASLLEPYSADYEVEPYVYSYKEDIISGARNYLSDYHSSDEDIYAQAIEDNDGVEYDEDGNEMASYNPDATWDWWELGGRWLDVLHIKDDVEDYENGVSLGETLTLVTTPGYRRVSSAKIKDINFDLSTTSLGALVNNVPTFLTYALLIEGQEWIEDVDLTHYLPKYSKATTYQEYYEEVLKDPRYQDYYLSIVDCHM